MDPRPPAAPSPATVPPDALVAHAGFVRGLAFAILRDDADADDATQEALVVGLASGPRDPAAARGWLAAVVRNVAYRFRRREARSETRERRASRAEAATATVDLVTREETLRSVVDAVGALDPASREVILLRHYEDLPPRAIAARLGLPVETVKKRLARAHATLRARLDAGEGASRRRRALAAFAGLPLGPREGTAAVAAGGGVAMASGTKAAALAAAALLVVGGSVWVVADRDGGAAGIRRRRRSSATAGRSRTRARPRRSRSRSPHRHARPGRPRSRPSPRSTGRCRTGGHGPSGAASRSRCRTPGARSRAATARRSYGMRRTPTASWRRHSGSSAPHGRRNSARSSPTIAGRGAWS